MDMSQERFCVEHYKKNTGPQAHKSHLMPDPHSGDLRIVRACAVEMHMDISQEPFCVEIYWEKAGPPGEHLD